jgi:hypothetical protein
VVVVRVEPDAAFAEDVFGALDVVSPAFKDSHRYNRAFLCPAHVFPVHWWARMQDHPVFQAGHNFPRGNYVHQHWVGGDYPAESFRISVFYFLLDVYRVDSN